MAETSAPSELGKVTFYVKSAGNQKWTITLPLDTTTIDLKNKLATEEFANVPAASQRLIYSGKVLKDHETLASHSVKEGNTMHLVKSAASNQRQNPAGQSTSTTDSSSQVPPGAGVPQNLASGTGNDPLAGLTGARYAGFAGLPSLESLANPPTPDEMLRRLQDPNFAQQMNEALQNPQMIDMMINMNPQLRAMGPQARQMLQSEHFRRMMTNPEALRSMMNLQNAMGVGGGNMFGGAGGNPFGGAGAGGQEAFPAPGVTNAAEQPQTGTRDATQTEQQNQQNPFASMFGTGNAGALGFPPPSGNPSDPQQNPFLSLLNPSMFGQQAGQAGANTTDPNNPSANTQNPQQANPFGDPMANPLLAQLLGGGMGGMGGFPQAPPDNRPPEERFSTQLRQLNEMGFYDFDRNVQALNRSGGDVNGALEWLFSQPQQ